MVRRKQEEVHNSQNVNYKSIYNIFPQRFLWDFYNGYGDFFFLNPFAKAMRLWGLKDLSKLIYKGRELFELHGDEIKKPCSDEDFMGLYERFPEFDDLDDEFMEHEEEYTARVAQYLDEHLLNFIEIDNYE